MKLGLILAGSFDRPLPSTRVALLNLLPGLRAHRWDFRVLHAPERACETPTLGLDPDAIASSGVDVVVFQKVYGPDAVQLAVGLRSRGVRSVFLVCDRVVPEMAAAVDLTLTVTRYLKSLYPVELQARIRVVHDGIERPEVYKASWREDRGTPATPLRAVLVTSSRLTTLPLPCRLPRWLSLRVVGDYALKEPPLQRATRYWRHLRQNPRAAVRAIALDASSKIAKVPWHKDHVYDELCSADIGIIPIDRSPAIGNSVTPPGWSVKSENRLTLKMSIGLPVIATPIPAYVPVVRQGHDAFLAEQASDWRDAFEALRDPLFRREMGGRARVAALLSFSRELQLQRLLASLDELLVARRSA